MPIGYVTGNQGESRYTVAIPRKTPLLAALIEARRVEIEGIDRVLEELRKHETDRRAVYDAAMVAVEEAMAGYTECRESYTEPQCRSTKIAAANSAYSDARDACIDTWRDCRGVCDIGDGDCSGACDDARDACELAAETTRDRALAAVDRLCVDEVVAHLQACQAQWAPVIASAQAAAVEALAPLQDAMIAIAWERTRRTSAVRRLNELLGVQSRAEMATCWAAQYDDELPTGPVPAEPNGAEENAVTVATVSGRAVITSISSVNPCAHDARALPADVLFVDAALAPGAETWRPTWRTGTVVGRDEVALRVRVAAATLPGSLGTVVSRRNINCTPPGAFFDADGIIDARVGAARIEYEDAIEDRNDILVEIQECKAGFVLQECTAPRNEVCEYNREQSMMACIDNRDYCLSIAQDANGEQYCYDQFAVCEQQVDAIFSACVDGATADCLWAKQHHDAQCEQINQFALSQAETAVSTALTRLINASADLQGPPSELVMTIPVAHCTVDTYQDGDDVLIDFPGRATSTGLDWATATADQIREAAMTVWNSARVVGWASETRECDDIPEPPPYAPILGWRYARFLVDLPENNLLRLCDGSTITPYDMRGGVAATFSSQSWHGVVGGAAVGVAWFGGSILLDGFGMWKQFSGLIIAACVKVVGGKKYVVWARTTRGVIEFWAWRVRRRGSIAYRYAVATTNPIGNRSMFAISPNGSQFLISNSPGHSGFYYPESMQDQCQEYGELENPNRYQCWQWVQRDPEWENAPKPGFTQWSNGSAYVCAMPDPPESPPETPASVSFSNLGAGSGIGVTNYDDNLAAMSFERSGSDTAFTASMEVSHTFCLGGYFSGGSAVAAHCTIEMTMEENRTDPLTEDRIEFEIKVDGHSAHKYLRKRTKSADPCESDADFDITSSQSWVRFFTFFPHHRGGTLGPMAAKFTNSSQGLRRRVKYEKDEDDNCAPTVLEMTETGDRLGLSAEFPGAGSRSYSLTSYTQPLSGYDNPATSGNLMWNTTKERAFMAWSLMLQNILNETPVGYRFAEPCELLRIQVPYGVGYNLPDGQRLEVSITGGAPSSAAGWVVGGPGAYNVIPGWDDPEPEP